PRGWAGKGPAAKPQISRSAIDSQSALLKTMHTDHLDWSLPAHRRGTLRGVDAA
ncbi:hypothetical protein GS645_18175, partial [Xanthomonas hortorum pv. gardneri]